jgi:hypothetical protein
MFFFEKRTKKLFRPGAVDSRHWRGPKSKSLFASFSSEKEDPSFPTCPLACDRVK